MAETNCRFPEGTKIAVKLDKLYRQKSSPQLLDRMSTRMVKCAALLEPGGFLGWQMDIPVKGKARMHLFGTEALCRDDLDWIAEKTGKTAKCEPNGEILSTLTEVYEFCLPIAYEAKPDNEVRLGLNRRYTDEEFAKWPLAFSAQFVPLIRTLRDSGTVLRAVIGPATGEERTKCLKTTLHSFDINRHDVRDYVGNPVRARVLLRLPAAPSIRLKSVLEEAVSGAKLRFLGSMTNARAADAWDSPLRGAAVLPDYAARILMMEPCLSEAVIGVELCEEKAKPIPASHKNPKEKNAIELGRATDASGAKRKITVSELSLRRHYQIVGQSGSGKSTLLAAMTLSAIRQGYGLTFFDPHGSTVDTVLHALPEKYADRVRVVRIGDADHPVPVNIWDCGDPVREERNISDLCELFGDIFDPNKQGFVGPRYERWLSLFSKLSLALLGRSASFESISVISQSQDNMLKACRAVASKYPELVESIKQEYGLDKSSDWHQTLAWLLCKFQKLTSVEQLRATFGAGADALDFAHTIDTDVVTLIDLGSPALGSNAARVAGTMLLMKLWRAALERKDRAKTHLVVLDEAALFQSILPKMLAESRKFGLAITLCCQHSSQLTQEIREALEANSANFSAFRLSPRDAATAAIRFDDPSMSVSLTRLDTFRAITTLSVNEQQTAPFTLEINRPKPQSNGEEIAAMIEKRSIETLVEPYRDRRALTAAEILDILNHPEKRANKTIEELPPVRAIPELRAPGPVDMPYWLREWTNWNDARKSA